MWLSRCFKLLEKPQFWLVYLSILCVYFVWTRRKFYLLSWRLPGPVALPIIGNIYIFLQKGIADGLFSLFFALEEYRSPCRLIRLWIGLEFYVLVGDAGVASQINRMGLKPDVYNLMGGSYLAKGLVQDTDVAHWRWARKFCYPAFQIESLKCYLPLFHAQSLISAREFEEFATSGQSVMPIKLIGRYTMLTALSNLFGHHVRDVAFVDRIQKMLDTVMEHFQNRLAVPAFRSNFIYWLCGLRQKEQGCMKALLDFLQDIIDELKTNDSTDNSFGTQMLKAGIPEDEILIQGATLIGASVDTTKIQNTVVLLMLALHPDVQNKLRAEITRVLGDDVTRVPTVADIQKLDYLERVLKECMRILPAVPAVLKKAYHDLTLTADDGEYTIPAGMEIHKGWVEEIATGNNPAL